MGLQWFSSTAIYERLARYPGLRPGGKQKIGIKKLNGSLLPNSLFNMNRQVKVDYDEEFQEFLLPYSTPVAKYPVE